MKKEKAKNEAKKIKNKTAFINAFRKAYNDLTRESQVNMVRFIQSHDEYTGEDLLDQCATEKDEKRLRRAVKEASRHR